ncbi:type I-E CRISPR-associated protein Cas6/Cse3/CasE [Nocardiopsis sp. CNT-189]|uniref:type I-E CRISPR-associated protein Cas6/Cse3/CasE n=1 Tax=Nocardiopsis oceanisediminis TaxID=2816862 RepID=UPI003B394223
MPVRLIKIELDDRLPRVRQASAGDLHRILLKTASPSLGDRAIQSPRRQAGLLFRVEETRAGRHLLVQTQCELLLDRLPNGFEAVGAKDLAPLLDSIGKGDVLRYRITGSPMKRLGKSERPREIHRRDGKRLDSGAHERPLTGAAADAWWEGKAEQSGFNLLSASSTRLRENDDSKGERRVRLPAVRFDGLARVHDADAVRAAVLNGVGRGKAFGSGMLSLAHVGGR